MRPLWREALIWYYSLAQRQINPLHPDVPAIVLRLNTLVRERQQLLKP